MVVEDHKGIFIGKETVMICNYKREDNNVLIKKRNRYLPFKSDWTPMLGNLKAQLKNFTELSLIDGCHGRTDEKIRVFFFDADTLQPFDPGLNKIAQRELETLKRERDYLYHSLLDLQNNLKSRGLLDLIKKNTKELMDFSQQISPFRSTPRIDPKKRSKK